MSNVIDFPKKGVDFEVFLDNAEEKVFEFQERIHALADILDLNIQGMYHVIEAETDEIMMALLHLSAVWAVRSNLDAQEYIDLVRSINLEILEDGEE